LVLVPRKQWLLPRLPLLFYYLLAVTALLLQGLAGLSRGRLNWWIFILSRFIIGRGIRARRLLLCLLLPFILSAILWLLRWLLHLLRRLELSFLRRRR